MRNVSRWSESWLGKRRKKRRHSSTTPVCRSWAGSRKGVHFQYTYHYVAVGHPRKLFFFTVKVHRD